MNALTVAPCSGIERVSSVTLASLPVSYAPAPDPDQASVVVVSGAGDWASVARRRLDRGCGTVIVVHPEPADLGPLEQASGSVVIDSVWAGNPAVSHAAEEFTARAGSAQLLECRVVSLPGRSLAANVLDAAALVRALTGPLRDITFVHADSHGLTAAARSNGLEVAVSIVRTNARRPFASARLLTGDGGIELTVPEPGTARPALVTITDPDGLQQLPTIWESAHRAAWRRVAAGVPSSDLADFAADQLLLAALDPS